MIFTYLKNFMSTLPNNYFNIIIYLIISNCEIIMKVQFDNAKNYSNAYILYSQLYSFLQSPEIIAFFYEYSQA